MLPPCLKVVDSDIIHAVVAFNNLNKVLQKMYQHNIRFCGVLDTRVARYWAFVNQFDLIVNQFNLPSSVNPNIKKAKQW